jgi:hypothetical protein
MMRAKRGEVFNPASDSGLGLKTAFMDEYTSNRIVSLEAHFSRHHTFIAYDLTKYDITAR